MKKLLIIVCLLYAAGCISQNKQDLIDYIIKENRVDSEHIGASGSVSPLYKKYTELMALLDNDELLQLTNHKNAALRVYAIKGAIARGIGDIPHLFERELRNDSMVETFEGCIMGEDLTSMLIYNFQRYDAEESQHKNKIGKELDNIIINTDHYVWWLLYRRVFENKVLDEVLLPRIEKLAFEKNNSYAFMYLKIKYPDRYAVRMENYLLTVFPKQKFTENQDFIHDNDAVFVRDFIKLLLDSQRSDYRKVAIEKLREVAWLKKRDMWFDNILEKHNIQL